MHLKFFLIDNVTNKIVKSAVYYFFTRIFILTKIANKFVQRKKKENLFFDYKRIYECAIFHMRYEKGNSICSMFENQIYSEANFMLNPLKIHSTNTFALIPIKCSIRFYVTIIHECFRLIYPLLIIQWKLFLYLAIFFLQIDTFFAWPKSIQIIYLM